MQRRASKSSRPLGAHRVPKARSRILVSDRKRDRVQREQQPPNVHAPEAKRSYGLIGAASANLALAVLLFGVVNVTPYFVALHSFKQQNNLVVPMAAVFACLCMALVDFGMLFSVDTRRRSQAANSTLRFPGKPPGRLTWRYLFDDCDTGFWLLAVGRYSWTVWGKLGGFICVRWLLY